MDILSLRKEEIRNLPELNGAPAFRSDQLFKWLHNEMAESYDEMTNLPKSLREELEEKYPLCNAEIIDKRVSKIDGTVKYLFGFSDGSMIEAVLMQYEHGASLCISSQVGCRMGCSFCASGINGLSRNLSAGEMLSEVYAATKDSGKRIGNIVIMGTGEPLDNFDNLVRFLELIKDKDGANLGGRNVTVSTCGLVPEIKKFADEKFTCGLALSLHAPTDEIRQKIMPIAKRYGIDETLDALFYYGRQTGRRVTIEYSLIEGVNDREEDADTLGSKLSKYDFPCLVNLIKVNPVVEKSHVQPRDERVLAFKKMLEKYRINVTIRRELGRDIEGACGQLRLRHMSKKQ